jgi:transcription elongation factor GreA-like protein
MARYERAAYDNSTRTYAEIRAALQEVMCYYQDRYATELNATKCQRLRRLEHIADYLRREIKGRSGIVDHLRPEFTVSDLHQYLSRFSIPGTRRSLASARATLKANLHTVATQAGIKLSLKDDIDDIMPRRRAAT